MQRIVAASGTLLVGLLLLSLAVPRLVAHLLLLPGDAAADRALGGESLSPQGYQRILDTRRAALAWLEWPEARVELGGALYRMAQDGDALHLDAAALLQEARRQLERGLAEAPADAYAWAWLADIRRFQGDPDGAAQALRLSMLAAPRDAALAPLRAGMALALWDGLDADTRAMARADVGMALGAKGARPFVRRTRDAELLAPLRRAAADDPVANATLWLVLRRDEAAGWGGGRLTPPGLGAGAPRGGR